MAGIETVPGFGIKALKKLCRIDKRGSNADCGQALSQTALPEKPGYRQKQAPGFCCPIKLGQP